VENRVERVVGGEGFITFMPKRKRQERESRRERENRQNNWPWRNTKNNKNSAGTKMQMQLGRRQAKVKHID